jgi:tetratricopeptide (TPR) repeat protein
MSKRLYPLFLLTALLLISVMPALAQEVTPTPEPPPDCPVFEDQSQEVRTSYYMGEGIAYFSSNQLFEAELSFSCVVEVIDPQYVPAYMMRATVLVQQRAYEDAIEDYTSVIALQPDLLAAYNNRGIIYAAQLDYEKAAEDFDQVLEMDETSVLGLNNRGVIYTIEGDYANAIATFQKAIDTSGIADVYTRLTDPDRPADAPEIEYERLDARAYALLGIVYSAQALDNFQTYLYLSGGSADGRIQSAAGALESRFTFETRLDDGTWLLVANFSPVEES